MNYKYSLKAYNPFNGEYDTILRSNILSILVDYANKFSTKEFIITEVTEVIVKRIERDK